MNTTGHQTRGKPRLKNIGELIKENRNRWGRKQTQLGGMIINEHGNGEQEKPYMDMRGEETQDMGNTGLTVYDCI